MSLTPDGFGFCGDRATLAIDGDLARRKKEDFLDKHNTVTESTYPLASPDYYQACLDGGEARMLSCLTELVR